MKTYPTHFKPDVNLLVITNYIGVFLNNMRNNSTLTSILVVKIAIKSNFICLDTLKIQQIEIKNLFTHSLFTKQQSHNNLFIFKCLMFQ